MACCSLHDNAGLGLLAEAMDVAIIPAVTADGQNPA